MSLEGVKDVKSVLTAQQQPGAAAPHAHKHSAEAPVQAGQTRVRKGARLSDEAVNQGNPGGPAQIASITGISRILVVASAKGGVGKSTVSVNLAAAFAKQGLRVGLLDADVYGPSIPTMLNTADISPETNSNGKLVPVEAHGILTLSIGYLTDPDAPMIWRGPIVQSAITQMLNDAAWGTPENPLDLLIIDTPPGTGEAQLTLAQKVPVTAAIIVTTPQEVALADVRRGAAMFAKTHVPILGIIETMSWFEDPAGNRHHLMGDGGGEKMAKALGLPLLGQLPMVQAIREGGDSGTPAALTDDAIGATFTGLAREVALSLDALQTKPAPAIIFED
jgi:ATP-binding protein involved in chromosome partitioning